MTDQTAEPDPGEDSFVGEPPAGDASPDEYVSNDQQGGVSEDTGTSYDRSGEPEKTSHDEEPEDEEDA